MSLTKAGRTIFIQATDNRLYKNPSWLSGLDWYVKFTDDDDPYIIVKRWEGASATACKKAALGGLKTIGFNATVSEPICESNAFPPEWKGLHASVKMTISLKGPIPIPKTYEAVVDTPAVGMDYMAWLLPFQTEDAYFLCRDGLYHSNLLKFICGKTIHEFEFDSKIKRQVSTMISKQHKRFRENVDKLSVAEIKRIYGPTLLIQRKKAK